MSAVVAELQSRHATEVRSYVRELWDGDDARAAKSIAEFWRAWVPPPGSADEIPREYVFAGARRHVVAEQRGAGVVGAENDADTGDAEGTSDPSTRIAARFRRLTAKQQEMVQLHLHHRFDLDEMAEITELPVGSATQLLHTAISRLNGASHEDGHVLQLALTGATGERLAAESPDTRNRVADLRVTIEVARQVLARGPEEFRPRKRVARRRMTRWIAAAVGGLALGAAALWWLNRAPAPEASVAEETTRGQSRVAVRRGAGDAVAKPVRPNSETTNETPRATAPAPARQARNTSLPARSAPASATAAEQTERSASPSSSLDPAAVAAPESAPTQARRPDNPLRAPAAIPRGATGAVGRERAQPHETPRESEEHASRLLPDRLDTAPISALRRALGAGRWPERRDVRLAALLNSVPPSTRPPPASAPAFTAQIESSESPWQPARRLVRVALRAREHVPAVRAPATVILLLDVSGSMDAPNRLPLVQTAVAGLLRRLQPDDRVGVVTYAGESRVLLPPAVLTDERAVRAAVDGLAAKGRTNGGAGLREAFRLAASDAHATGERIVILCTDGDFNMGETSEAELGALIDRQRDTGVRLAIFGFGRPDRIDARLEALAARARGGSGYVNTRAEAEQALVSQLDALFAPVAEKLEATVEFDPARVARFRPLGEAEMRPAAAGVQVPVASRERVLPGETLSALFEVEPVAGSTSAGADLRVRLSCRSSAAGEDESPENAFWPGQLSAGGFAEASVDFRFAAATAAFAEALQVGPADAAPRLDDIEQWARGAIGEDVGGYRAELLGLIAQARHAAGR